MSQKYYDHFNSQTEGGLVFSTDMSSLVTVVDRLHKAEVKERKEWAKTFNKIREHYREENPERPVVTSKEGVLQQRLIAPCLAFDNVTRRTGATEARSNRMYPHMTHVAVWKNFVGEVQKYKVSNKKVNKMYPAEFAIFDRMLTDGKVKCRSEEEELAFLLTGLRFLTHAKICGEIQKETGVVGRPDFVFKGKDGESIGIVVEGKSTHNLMIPVSAKDFVKTYQAAYEAVIEEVGSRTMEWVHVAHPFAQLIGYLVDNNHRYGALTSATRTIFVYISGTGKKIKVNVSEPYYIGEEDYLRAWAYVYCRGCRGENGFNTPTDDMKWITTRRDSPTPQPTPPKKNSASQRKRKRTSRSSQDSSKEAKKTSLSSVDFQDLKIGKEIAIGRNGSLFRVSWKGKEYALKQFDVGKDGVEGFEKEIAAYERMEEVWGKLVPRPYFVSETPSGGVKLLGLQLGSPIDDVSIAEDELWRQWQQAHAVLENEYGIRHNDAESGRNSILIDCHGHSRLAIIDFESWDDLWAE